MKTTTTEMRLAGLICFLIMIFYGCGLSSTPSHAADQSSRAPLFIEVPNPLSGENPTYKLVSQNTPSPGQSIPDPQFRTTQTRVIKTESLRHEYSRHDPFNKDQTMILLTFFPKGEWRVYRTQSIPYDQSGNLVRTLEMEEPRWDPVDRDLIWGFQEFRIVTLNVKTGQSSLIKDFSKDSVIGPIITSNRDLYRITTKDEGESSTDKRFWIFMLQGSKDDYRARYLFTWDRQANKVLGVYPLPIEKSRIDWVGMSPKGTWALIGGDFDNGGNLAGLTMANKELTQFHRLDYATAHSDVGLDQDGNEVIVMQNNQTDHIDLIPIDLKTKPILQSGGGYGNTNRVPLIRLFYDSQSPRGLNSGVHISCNVPGYCIISTNTEPKLPEQNWLDRTITLVKLDRRRPRVYYLAKVHGTRGEYWEETQATITNDGAKIVWATNWNKDVGKEKVWLMQLDMPAGWMNSLNKP